MKTRMWPWYKYSIDSDRFHDFFQTPAIVTEALLSVEEFPGTVWEPACGKGDISEVLKTHGHKVISTDRYHWGYGETGLNFFSTKRECDHIVTNPPFVRHQDFVIRARWIAKKKVALLLPITFLETPRRQRLLKQTNPKAIYIFMYRVPFKQPGRNHAEFAFGWYVWERGWTQETVIRWIEKPKTK